MGRTAEPNQSWWMTSEPPVPRPELGGDLAVDVAVVGGGITGLATARELHQRGVRVAVFEADRIASGSTGFTTAKVTALHGLAYADLVSRHGREKAEQYAAANQWAVDHIAGLVDPERLPAFTYTTDPDRVDHIEAEVEAARAAGLPATTVTTTDLPFPVAAAVRLDGQAQVHPRRLCNLLADGLEIFERTRVVDLDERDGGVVLRTEAGHSVTAQHVVLATLLPFDNMGGFFAKTSPVRSYAMAVRVRGPVPDGMFLGVDSPTRSVRPLRDIDGLVVGGNGHRVGEEDDTPAQYADLERWARDTFDVTEVVARWSAQDYSPVDHAPYIGRSPRRDNVYVATGFRKWGMTTGIVAGRLLADAITGVENPWAPVFDATRADVGGSAKDFVATNAHIVKPFLEGHLGPREKRCTHMGCVVKWNEAERSWDCPCHGSRFGESGDVLEGPAVVSLERRADT